MRKRLIAGNWKMNGSSASAEALLTGILDGIAAVPEADVAVLPAFPYLSQVASTLSGTTVRWGAQDLSEQDSGAFTGAVSGQMLADFNCHYVLVGHSERRALFGDSDTVVAAKFAAAQRHGLTPILCVGETQQEREAGATEVVVERQLNAVVDALGVAALNSAVLAYEPVWAIGTGLTATPEQAQSVHQSLRTQVASLDPAVAERVQILYGGSVKASNAEALLACDDIDGGLIGGASLDPAEFLAICGAS